ATSILPVMPVCDWISTMSGRDTKSISDGEVSRNRLLTTPIFRSCWAAAWPLGTKRRAIPANRQAAHFFPDIDVPSFPGDGLLSKVRTESFGGDPFQADQSENGVEARLVGVDLRLGGAVVGVNHLVEAGRRQRLVHHHLGVGLEPLANPVGGVLVLLGRLRIP